MDLTTDISGLVGDAAVAAEEITESAMAMGREQEALGADGDQVSLKNKVPVSRTRALSKRNDGYSLRDLLSSFSINLILPFINGLMLGFGEIIAHEIGFRYNWVGAKIYRPEGKRTKNQSSKLL